MSQNKRVRSISFNKTNAQDVARLKLIGKKSFSKFIKKLLDDEIKRVEAVNHSNTDTPQQPKQVVPPKPQQQRVVRPQQPIGNWHMPQQQKQQMQNNPMFRGR